MKTVTVRNLVIGEGMPKICIPMTGSCREELIAEIERLSSVEFDLVEWRVDHFQSFKDLGAVKGMISELRDRLGETPLLFTFRTKAEGGERSISAEDYITLNELAMESGADLIDIELFGEPCGEQNAREDQIKKLISSAKIKGVGTVMSSHDFQKTPGREELMSRLRRMEELGADILKLAVMPQSPSDVALLLEVTEAAAGGAVEQPVVTMSMGELGVISRLTGELFGSAITFGTVGTASAPGQIPAADLKELIKVFHGQF